MGWCSHLIQIYNVFTVSPFFVSEELSFFHNEWRTMLMGPPGVWMEWIWSNLSLRSIRWLPSWYLLKSRMWDLWEIFHFDELMRFSFETSVGITKALYNLFVIFLDLQPRKCISNGDHYHWIQGWRGIFVIRAVQVVLFITDWHAEIFRAIYITWFECK